MAEFLGSSLTDRQLDDILHATSFEQMKDNDLVNYAWWTELNKSLMRKGIKPLLNQ